MRAKLIELFTRAITVSDAKKKIYNNGADNNYPERVERVENNSVTAKLAANKLADYIIGFGFEGDINEKIANPIKGYTYFDILCLIANDLKTHKGFYLHVNYDVENNVNSLDVLPFKKCRVSKEDDLGYPGLVYYRDSWDEQRFVWTVKHKDEKHYYPYNKDPKVIAEQRKKDAGIKKNQNIGVAEITKMVSNYRGQVMYVNLDKNSVYPLSFIDPAYNDADTEFRISQFRNDQVRNGFIGATVVVVPEEDSENGGLVTDEMLKGLLGSENASNIMKIEAKIDGDQKLSDVIHIQTVESNIKTERFKHDEERIESNILNSYAVPKELVKGNDGALFSANSDSLQFLKEEFNESTDRYRKLISNTLTKVLGAEVEIQPLIETSEEEEVIVEPIIEEDGE